MQLNVHTLFNSVFPIFCFIPLATMLGLRSSVLPARSQVVCKASAAHSSPAVPVPVKHFSGKVCPDEWDCVKSLPFKGETNPPPDASLLPDLHSYTLHTLRRCALHWNTYCVRGTKISLLDVLAYFQQKLWQAFMLPRPSRLPAWWLPLLLPS